MMRRWTPVLLLALALGQVPGTVQAGDADIGDFMTMDVCVDAGDRPLPLVPGDTACTRMRDARPGEIPPYGLHNFAGRRSCAPDQGGDQGTIERLNLPVTRDGQTRIVSSNTPVTSNCAEGAGPDRDPSPAGASIQWHDEAYGFIMGSYSPVALSVYQSPGCVPGSRSSRRFFRGWIIGPAKVPEVGAAGFGVFESSLAKGAASDVMGACPTRYRSAFTAWLVSPMRFKSGREMTALVSSHFAQVSKDGLSPGATLQMEQTYWTRAFGLSRWEKWARADWTHPRGGESAPELARRLFKSGRCSPPVGGTVDISARTRFSPGPPQPDAYTRIISDPVSGESHLWYLTLCEDYTNTIPRPAAPLPDSAGVADRAYWAP
ncbi:hypothetical protein AncyloWKF20_01350 [Ancylobacter sp. WKF20]|uniref:hypothetical protein n=1 Tax=Ancylobacter sp. WKF20 TaxID=3039801 RepID=UPI002434172E|nr:hypothetical protein [Ancylobacter sp. WKF20]WGD30517.1 hypothetical protein AncyloWKF20_01350 [Ancylobacter sp. WKF20]